MNFCAGLPSLRCSQVLTCLSPPAWHPECIPREEPMDTHRLESLSDNVFAVAMTLLVFDLRVPTSTTRENLGSFLFEKWPHYIGYAISFVVIALIWLQHHWVFRHLQRVDSTIFLLNLALMVIVVFLPFTTSTLAFYISEHRSQASSAAFFGFNLTAASAVVGGLWWWTAAHQTLLRSEVAKGRAEASKGTVRQISRRLLLAPCLYLAAGVVAIGNTTLALSGYAAIALSYLWLLRPGLLGPGTSPVEAVGAAHDETL